ncbi:hypothetical protein Halha_0924 [Halobacteroides halobius DSM 5150]|uniref:DUF1232 domain-containing protein n=1 Tax=Halobacteroides halobius (strain ATCC 35273 / DSM 5150 / MD-1) TaxID=748449 RepID=L0K8M2_HALHC|nr:YkvA family protein [Halobacteroides halobius]AGB40885.1 hypothetical protein Halha_0924 [Halobacteroides halobius DSM 5150]
MKQQFKKIKKIFGSLKLAGEYLMDSEASLAKKILLVTPLFYIIAPFDLVSDIIPILGWLDDTVIGLVLWNYMYGILSDYNSKDDKADYTLDDDEYDIE